MLCHFNGKQTTLCLLHVAGFIDGEQNFWCSILDFEFCYQFSTHTGILSILLLDAETIYLTAYSAIESLHIWIVMQFYYLGV